MVSLCGTVFLGGESMAKQALYRKWRPLVFSDVVGQEHITEVLKREVENNRLSHAYLFTGTRGTGKTTCAKIMARAVNCLNPINGDPCNECASCRAILSESTLEVSEIDAASNNGVENVRSLRDEIKYPPVELKYRVYIIDEVHMLSTGAFNALLKTLEEPPSDVIFILATTELHKVPGTILSRCQRFMFKRILPEDISERLMSICQKEGVSIDKAAAHRIANMSEGALRDAISILDQAIVASEDSVDEEAVLNLLGLSDRETTENLIAAVADARAQDALNIFSELYMAGKDIRAFLGELALAYRDMLVCLATRNQGETVSGCNVEFLKNTAVKFGSGRLLSSSNEIQNTIDKLATSLSIRTDAELCIIKLCCGRPNANKTAKPAVEIKEAPQRAQNIQQEAKKTEKPVNAPVTEKSVRGDLKQEIVDRLPPSTKNLFEIYIKSVELQNGKITAYTDDNNMVNLLKGNDIISAMESLAKEKTGDDVRAQVVFKDKAVTDNSSKLRELEKTVSKFENFTII